MRRFNPLIYFFTMMIAAGCGSLDKIARHDFDSGYYRLKTPDEKPVKVYADVSEDSLDIYPVLKEEKFKYLDTINYRSSIVSLIRPGDFLYNSTFTRVTPDMDLTTALLKFRPAQKDVPPQLSANLNAAIYFGAKKDYFRIITRKTPLHQVNSRMNHFGFDAGFFAGIGITPVKYTVTDYNVELEYDGIVFEKGVAFYFGINFLTFGVAIGFDNLLDDNRKYWVYNQKPWIGLMLGIANF